MVKKVQEEKVIIPESVVPEAPKVDTGLELYGKLRNEINAGRENFTQQLKQTRETIEALRIQSLKLEGAIEASDIYLKAVLPSNNPSK